MDDGTLMAEFGRIRGQLDAVALESRQADEAHESTDRVRFASVQDSIQETNEVVQRGIGALAAMKWMTGILVALVTSELGMRIWEAMEKR